jgi:hypothetical protein
MYAPSFFGVVATFLALGGAVSAQNVYERALLAARQTSSGSDEAYRISPPSLPIKPSLTPSSKLRLPPQRHLPHHPPLPRNHKHRIRLPPQRHLPPRPPRPRRVHVRRLLLLRLDRLSELRLRARRAQSRRHQRLPHHPLLRLQRALHRHPHRRLPVHLPEPAVQPRRQRLCDRCHGSVSESDGCESVFYGNWAPGSRRDYGECDVGD